MKQHWANWSLLITTIVYIFINGAGAFETFARFPVDVPGALRQKAQEWKSLNLLREGLFTILSLVLVPLNKVSHEKLL